MAEVIGGVSVSITGDVSQLNAALGSAVSIAGNAGGKVASAFNAGAIEADQFSAATAAAAAAEGEFAGATETANAALGHQVSQIQATSGALRVLEGNSALRAAERFLTTIPGLGAALQFAFPVVGAIALFEGLSRVLGKSEELKAAEKELADATQRADEAFGHMEDTLDHLNVEHVTAAFGAAAGKRAETTVLEQQLQGIKIHADDARDSINQIAYAEANSLKNYIPFHSPAASVDKIKAAQQDVKALDSQAQEIQGRIDQSREDANRALVQQTGALGEARVKSEEQTVAHLAALNKAYSDESIEQTHSAVQLQIAAMHDRESAAVSTAAEELRVAQAKEQAVTQALASEVPKRIALIRAGGAAEAAGKSAPEQARIGVETQTKVGDFQAEADQKALAAHAETVKAQSALDIAQADRSRQVAEQLATAWERSYDAITAAAKKTQDEVDAGVERQIAANARVMEVQEKSAGALNEGKIQAQKIALEGQYGSEVAHTLEQQITYMGAIAALDSQARQAKIAGLQAELQVAETLDEQSRDLVKIATLKGQIAQLSQADANASQQAANAAAKEALTKSAGGQLAASINKAPGQLAGAVAGGIVDGKNIGKDIRESLKGIGKEMLGEVFTGLITALLGNTISTIANTAGIDLNNTLLVIKSFLGFASGTDSAPGGMALVGEKGPEIVNLPRGSQVIPNHAIKGYANGTSYSSTAFQTGSTNLHFHAHGMSNPDKFIDHVMRKLPDALKARSSAFSPYSK